MEVQSRCTELAHCYSVPDRGRQSIMMSLSVSVGVFLLPRSYIQNYTSDLHQHFYACYVWLWLGPPLATWHHVMYFRFF